MTHFFQRSALLLLATSALVTAAIPAEAAKRKSSGASAVYVVKSGDNLDRIAKRMGVSVDELKAANGLKGSSLQPGDKLKNPKAKAPPKATAKGKGKGKSGAASREPAEEPTAEAATYKVKRGDTLFAISQRVGVSVDDLRKANGLSSRASISAGQVLKLSSEQAEEPPVRKSRASRAGPAPSDDDNDPISDRAAAGRVINVPGAPSTYKVRKGDNLARVADKLNTTTAQLKRDNRIKGSTIHAGQVLRGPGRSTAKAYVAASGDTLATVAARFSISTAQLRAANGLSRRATIRAGQRLRLPSDYRDRGAGSEQVREPYREPPRETPNTYNRPSREPDAPIRTQPDTSGLPSRPQPYAPSNTTPIIPPPGAGAIVSAPPPSDAQISQLGRGRFVWPLRGEVLSEFGPKPGGQKNDGLNIQVPAGEPVHVAADGDVVYAGDQVPGFGNIVLVKHPDGWVTAYAHLSRVDVKMQQHVTQGQQIGQVGSTGGVAEPQLHFEVRYAPSPLASARPIDPKLVLPR